MRASSFKYLLGEGARSIWVNRLMSFASVGVMVSCLLLIGGAILLSENVLAFVGIAQEQNEVWVYLKSGMSDEEIAEAGESLQALGDMSVELYSRDEVLEDTIAEYRAEGNERAAAVYESYRGEENPLADCYILKLRDIDAMDEIEARIRTMPYVDNIYAPTELAATLLAIQQLVTAAGVGIVIILGVVSLLMIANTIRLSVFSRRKEVNIMKFVGATDAFIRLPFMVEGVLLGLLASSLAYGILFAGYTYLIGQFDAGASQFFKDMAAHIIPFSAVALPLAIGFVGAGVGIGVIGSMLFVRKYLRV